MDLVAEMAVLNPFDFFLEPYAETFPFAYQGAEKRDLAPYLVMFRGEPQFKDYLRHDSARAQTHHRFSGRAQREARQRHQVPHPHGAGRADARAHAHEASGSCRDSAWLLVQLLRHMGLAARFVSGYLIQLTADMKSLDGPSGPEKDFTDLHAWCEVYLPGAGWIGLDPTSGLLAGEGHIPLACTPEPGAAAPVTGAVDKAEVEFEHHMKVRAHLGSAARHQAVHRSAVDRRSRSWAMPSTRNCSSGDVRLTMGGEPTFVSVDDPDGAEWNTTAMGPDKRRLAIELYDRLKQKYAPQGLSHFGQGKWYPGEQLPRWSLNCFWRRDGEPIWTNPELLDDEKQDRGVTAGRRRAVPRGRRRAAGARRPSTCSRRSKTPSITCGANAGCRRTSIHSSRSSSDPQERARLAKVFEQGLDTVVGHVLPVSRDVSGTRWQHRLVVPAPRALLPDSGRLADRLPAAARLDAVGQQGRLPVHP